MLENLYNQRKLGNLHLEKYLGINIDFYFEILPKDIQEQYKNKHITVTGEVVELLRFIQDRIHHGSLYKLFWENDKQISEDRIQIILENLMERYFYHHQIEITREALLGSGKIDFKLYKNQNKEEKVLIEVKKASNTTLKKGYERQLVKYLQSSTYENAFCLIICFTDKEYQKAIHFIKNHVYTNTIQLYINISILDVRKKVPASKNISNQKISTI